MPVPPNMFRTSTRPKAANSSEICSESTAADRCRSMGGGFVRRRQLHGFPASAGGNLVRVVEHELGGELVDFEVHLGPEQEQHRLGIDQETHALVLDDLVGRLGALGIFHRI